ncbi:alpha-ribazole phosphatase family protein [Propionivibrio sp.]|uniref:alpha-ribazole phosphatase family protein n=1 Tax=Propionivibrio sp. TaxID=2212460 RepID=UPI003BF36DC2
MQVFLIRHPRPLIDAGICYGQLDIESEDALPVSARLRPLLPEGTPVISSPLRRARQLAEALDPAARIDARLCEMDFGEWEGQSWEDIGRHALDTWAADVLQFTPPGGESAACLQQRAIAFAKSLNGPRVALVTHAGIMRALLGHWRQLPLGEWSQLKFEFGSITEIEIEPGIHRKVAKEQR